MPRQLPRAALIDAAAQRRQRHDGAPAAAGFYPMALRRADPGIGPRCRRWIQRDRHRAANSTMPQSAATPNAAAERAGLRQDVRIAAGSWSGIMKVAGQEVHRTGHRISAM